MLLSPPLNIAPPYSSDRALRIVLPNPFLDFSGLGKQKSSLMIDAESKRSYEEILNIYYGAHSHGRCFHRVSLLWISERAVTTIDRHIRGDERRLFYFNWVRENYENGTKPENSQKNLDFVKDLRFLRDKVLARFETVKSLRLQLETLQNPKELLVLGKVGPLEKKIEELLKKIQKELDDTTVDLQRELTLVQLEESRRAIEQNQMVRKLTILAFLYLPISTVSSVFGMNVQELQLLQYQPHIRVFCFVLLGVFVFSILLASFEFLQNVLYGVGSHYYIWDQIERYSRRSKIRYLFMLLRCAIIGIVYLFYFVFSYFPAIIGKMNTRGKAVRARNKKFRDEKLKVLKSGRGWSWVDSLN